MSNSSWVIYDTVYHNVEVVDVGRLRTFTGWIGVKEGRILRVEEGDLPLAIRADEIVDGNGQYAVPGLIDAHTHFESSFVTPRRFVEGAVPAGTLGVLADPHEIANVTGVRGIEALIRGAEGLPLEVFWAIPSCVPATSGELETSGAVFDLEAVKQVKQLSSRVIALGEVMDFVSLLQSSRLTGLLEWAKEAGLIIDGHCPSLTGWQRQLYFAQGIEADHTLMNPEKILSEVSCGVWVELQDKSLTKENIATVNGLADRSKILIITDDYSPNLFPRGHLNTLVAKAIELGMPPLEAIASSTIRPANYLRQPDLGMIAPGRYANFFLADDLRTLNPSSVYFHGRLVAKDACIVGENGDSKSSNGETIDKQFGSLMATVNVPAVEEAWFRSFGEESAWPVIVCNDRNTLTKLEQRKVEMIEGFPTLDEDVAVCSVLVRHRKGGTTAAGQPEGASCLLAGFGLKSGAIASSVAHDSHNLIVMGKDPADMCLAVNQIRRMQGGLVAVQNGKVLAQVELPIAGLLSDEPLWIVAEKLQNFENAMRKLGVVHARPVLFFVVFSLTVSPEYKLSDKGIIDVGARTIIS